MNDTGANGVAITPACAACADRIVAPYFAINGQVLCEHCRQSIERQLRGHLGLASLGRATLFGLGGAIAGAVIFVGVLSSSRSDWSIVAVLVGYLVGTLVRKGAGGLGGKASQVIAVALTYGSLAITFFAITIQQAGQVARPPTAEVLLSMLADALEMPLIRMRSSPIQVVFVGFALWEAWRLNRPRRFVVTGPHPFDTQRTGLTALRS
jgi:hypothetical protein